MLAVFVSGALAPAEHGRLQEGAVRVGGIPLKLAGEGSLWVLTCNRACSGEARESVGRIVRVDPQSGHVTASVTVRRPQALAVDSTCV